MEVIITGTDIEHINDNSAGTCTYDCSTYQ